MRYSRLWPFCSARPVCYSKKKKKSLREIHPSTSTGIYLAAFIVILHVKLNPSSKSAAIIDWLITSGLFVTAVTTLVSTLLIGYRIHSGSHTNIASGGGRRYAYILDILVQSAFLHVVGSLAVAIPLVFPLTAQNAVSVINAQSYTISIFPFTSVRDLRIILDLYRC